MRFVGKWKQNFATKSFAGPYIALENAVIDRMKHGGECGDIVVEGKSVSISVLRKLLNN